MKKFISFAALVAILATAFTFQACNKQAPEANVNPVVRELPTSPFQLSAVELRAGHTYPWTISKDGVTESTLENNDNLIITTLNEVTVTVTPDNSGTFAGVNVSSSNPNAVLVEIIDQNTFCLKRPSVRTDGRNAIIEVWNGSGSVINKIAFEVGAQQIIHPELFRIKVDGEDVDVTLYSRLEEANAHPVKLLSIPEIEKTLDFETCDPHEIIFDKLLPNNCEYDVVKYQVGHTTPWMEYLDDKGFPVSEWLQWNEPKDPAKYKPLFPYANDFEGRLDDLEGHNRCYVACHPQAMTLASQFVKQTVSFSVTGIPAYTWYATIYVEYPFASLKELNEWLEQ